MKIQGIIIKHQEQGVFFGFIKQFPAICAQGKTRNEVQNKIDKYFKRFIERMNSENIEMEEQIGY